MTRTARAQVSGNKGELLARLNGTAPPPKKARVAKAVPGVPAELAPLLDTDVLAKRLKADVKTLAQMVDADWHDGYEEQGEELCSYVVSLEPHLQAVLRVCTGSPPAPEAALARCNDVLVTIADSWRDMGGINFRCCKDEAVAEAKVDLSGCGVTRYALGEHDAEDEDEDEEVQLREMGRKDALTLAWHTLICAAASGDAGSDDLLLRILQDATSFDCITLEALAAAPAPTQEEKRWFSEAGAERLRALLAAGSTVRERMAALPSRLGKVKAYRAIDRRFSGPKHLRTRHYDDDSDEGGGGGFDDDDDGY